MTLPTGARIGAYEVIGPLGAGGMGEVYRARDLALGREVAIKILPTPFIADPDRLERFEREARLLASLNHPNVATIHGVERSGEIRGLVLELVDGDTLAARIAATGGRGLRLDETLAIARQIADGLKAAHDKGIVHRDLKPANIKIGPGGRVKVLDFGLAKAVGDERGDSAANESPTITAVGTRHGMILGTAAYMSPEQARGQVVDARTDVWAFGCVLFEMLSGRTAFGRATLSDTMAAVLEHEPEWNAFPADAPPAIVRLVRRCLRKDPDRRLHDIADVRIEIEDAASGESRDPVPDRRSHGLAAGRRWLPALAAAGVAIAAVALWMATAGSPRASAPRLSRAARVTNSAAQEFGPAISPDGKWVAYYANANGRTDLWVKFLDSGATSNLTAGMDLELPARTGIGGISISPDGAQIAFNARSGPAYDTWVMPAPIGGVPRLLLQVLQAMQWSPDGRQIVSIRPGSTNGDAVVLANADGSSQRDLVPAAPGLHIHWPAWSSDGRFIYFIHTYDTWHTEPSSIHRVPTAGGSPEPVVDSPRRAVYPVPMAGGDLIFGGNPDSVDLGLWWKARDSDVPQRLTVGVGEYTEPRLSGDGRKLVATLVDVRQSLVRLPVAGGGGPIPITDGYSGDLDPSLNARTDRLVFSSARSGRRNLWTARADGSDARPLTTEIANDERPVFSPDGDQVAFVSDRSGRQAIWLIGAEGGAPKLLLETLVLDWLTWSSDGARVIFAKPERERTGLFSVAVADGRLEPIATPGPACCPAASPTSDVIAYLQPTFVPGQGPSASPASRLWLRFVDGHGRAVHPDLPNQSFANGVLAWAPDGKRLAGAVISAAGASTLWAIEPGAPQPYRSVFDFPAVSRPRGLTWSRDGSSIILASQEFAGDIVMFEVAR